MILKQIKDDRWLQLILIITAAMRFYNYSNWSLSNDELSALTRLRATGFLDLITNGVRPDMHPAGVEVFLYYWVKLFGDSVASVRLPFVIAGIVAVLFVYLISEKWFGKTTARLTALSFAFLQYTILYSQLARPYSPGLLLSLMMAYYWDKIIFPGDAERKKKFHWGYIFTASLCMYTHYFSFLFALIVGATGLFFLKKEDAKPFFFSALTAILLFLPHVSISIEQFSRGGLSDWIGKPERDYFIKYLSYSFNDSVFFSWVLIAILVSSIALYFRNIKISSYHFICAIGFAAPFLIGYYYSVYINPVLQYSILIFSFPFLLMLLFSFFKEYYPVFNTVVIIILGITGICSTVIEKKFYNTKFFGVFKELAEKTIEWNEKYGKQNISRFINVIAPDYVNYYFNKFGQKTNYHFIRAGQEDDVMKMKRQVELSGEKYLLYAWSNSYNPPEFTELIKREYSKIIEHEKYFNSEITLFERDASFERVKTFEFVNDFDRNREGLICDSAKSDSTTSHSGKFSLRIEHNVEYACMYETNMQKLFSDSISFVNISAWCNFLNGDDAHLVIEYTNESGMYEWQSIRSNNFRPQSNEWVEIFKTIAKPKKMKASDKLKMYIWNPNKNTFFIDDVVINSFSDSK